MSPLIAINGRFQQRHFAGVDRYAHEISKRLNTNKYFITPKRPLGQITSHLWEQLVLPVKIQKSNILWSPANAGPWIVSNQVVTIHDASVFDHPEWFNPTFASWTRLSWKILARRVKVIITVSNFSRERLKFHLRIPDRKFHVIHNGVGQPFEPQSQKTIEAVKEKYELHKPYFLFIGTNEPRKNLAGLVEAWKSLNLETHSLFVAGSKGTVFSNKQSRETQPLRNPLYIPDEDLPALYSGAAAVVIPSFYEGFGLTILEAMACGAPVIASDIAVFRELFENSVLFCDPKDPKEIAAAIRKIIEDQSLASKLREQGFACSARLSWDESARKTQLLLESLQ